MPSLKQLYLSHVAQTSRLPLLLEVERSEGVFIWDKNGKRYFDMNSGIAVSSLGHANPEIIQAIHSQATKYMHTMVYGEHVQSPQVEYAQTISKYLDDSLNSLYFLMSGTEATELAMKICKRYTGRYQIISCKNAYHGSTQGAESLRSDLEYKNAFYPLLPEMRHIQFNNLEDLDQISENTAGVICEVVQGEAGVILPDPSFLKALRERCTMTGSLLIFDEIQSGFGRTGYLFAHQKYGVVPDLLLIGKAMGGGMPIAGVIGPGEIMKCLVVNPELGHITTFGGHPVCVSAALAALKILLRTDLIDQVHEKEKIIHQKLKHPIVKEIRSAGLMMAIELTSRKYLKYSVSRAFELGLIVDWFLFNDRSFRLAPPLIISEEELRQACDILLESLQFAEDHFKK